MENTYLIESLVEYLTSSYHQKQRMKLFFGLLQIGCCPDCSLRYFRSKKLYGISLDIWKIALLRVVDICAAADISLDHPKNLDNLCIWCLGLTQRVTSVTFAQEMAVAVRKSGFEFVDFTFNICLPSCFIIRQYSVWRYAQTVLGDTDKLCLATEIKEVLRDKTGDFKLEFEFVHFGTESDRAIIKHTAAACNVKTTKGRKRQMSYRGRHSVGKGVRGPSEQFIAVGAAGGDDATQDSNESPSTVQEEDGAGTELQHDVHAGDKRKRAEDEEINLSCSSMVLDRYLLTAPVTLFQEHGSFPPPHVSEPCSYILSFDREPIFVAGRYRKASRQISQSKFVMSGEVSDVLSIEDLFQPLLNYFKPDNFVQAAAGREDVDVRMLGNGRPFVLEFRNSRKLPCSAEHLLLMQEEMNSQREEVQFSSLQYVERAFCEKLKEAEQFKTKTYRCVVWVSRPLSSEVLQILEAVKDLQIEQQTPIRVLHRRAQMTRPKVIHHLRCTPINNHFMILDAHTSAGTYVKEFVHGDLGRTQPNIGSLLGCEADILQLDVLHVDFLLPNEVQGL